MSGDYRKLSKSGSRIQVAFWLQSFETLEAWKLGSLKVSKLCSFADLKALSFEPLKL
jgi:hypothetical protein